MRLEPAVNFIFEEPLPIFQFHKGAIRTGLRRHDHRLLRHFNSIKVRLELVLLMMKALQNRNFNSIKVRLEPVKSWA